MPLTPWQWQEVESLFSLAMQLPSKDRNDWRLRTGTVNVQIGEEVDALIASCDDSIRLAPMTTANAPAGRNRSVTASRRGEYGRRRRCLF